MQVIKYHFVLGTKKFLFEQEPLEEILRERVQNYNKKKKPLNFWILPNPLFLNDPEFKSIKSKNLENSIAIISTDKTFITWLKLRLNHVILGNFELTEEKTISPLKFIKTI
jgi:hypothetical protein